MKLIDVQDLLSAAKQRTGLSDFGEPDLLENLEVFIKAVNEGQGIADDRWEQCREYYIRLLMNRLWFAKDLKDHPEILDEEILPPVIILPQPRTGSTKLHRMLGASGSFQHVLWWHMFMMSRIPDKHDGGKSERIQATKDFEQWSLAMSPDMVKGHPLYAMTTEEEQFFHEMTFCSGHLAMKSSVSSTYFESLPEHSEKEAYDFLLSQLKYVQWQHYPKGDKPFVLKAPSNVGKEAHLMRLFGRKPKYLVLHRNPINVICSVAEITNHYRKIFSDVPTKNVAAMYGQFTLQHFSEAAAINMAWRDANPDIQILDLSYTDITQNSKAVLHNVYEFLEIPLNTDIEANIERWEGDKARNKYRRNNYSPEQFGLTEKEILDSFAPYIERFSEYIEL